LDITLIRLRPVSFKILSNFILREPLNTPPTPKKVGSNISLSRIISLTTVLPVLVFKYTLLLPVSQKEPARGSNRVPVPKVWPHLASILILIGKCNRNDNGYSINETGGSY
jgi:hypothetical protein